MNYCVIIIEVATGDINDVVGPMSEKGAEEYIPNPAPKNWKFIITKMSDPRIEFQGV